MANYKPEHEKVMNDMMKGVKNATAETMFGFPAYKVNGTLAVSVKAEGIIAKVGEKSAQKHIAKKGVKAYEPLPGRVWKEWVLITADFAAHKDIFAEAVKYVGAEPAKKETAKAEPAKAAPAKAAPAKKPAAKSSADKPAETKKPAAKKPAAKKKTK